MRLPSNLVRYGLPDALKHPTRHTSESQFFLSHLAKHEHLCQLKTKKNMCVCFAGSLCLTKLELGLWLEEQHHSPKDTIFSLHEQLMMYIIFRKATSFFVAFFMFLLNTNHNLLLSNGSMQHLFPYHSLPSSDLTASFDAHYLCFFFSLFPKNRVTVQCLCVCLLA